MVDSKKTGLDKFKDLVNQGVISVEAAHEQAVQDNITINVLSDNISVENKKVGKKITGKEALKRFEDLVNRGVIAVEASHEQAVQDNLSITLESNENFDVDVNDKS